jgi:hypothetical protein
VSNEAFEDWLIGFTEGEGSFTHKTDWTPRFSITQKNKPILDMIKSTLGFGCVYRHSKKRPDLWRYVVDGNWEALNTLRRLFDGRLRSDFKQRQFSFWIGLFDYDNPFRVLGREKEKLRGRRSYLKDRQSHIDAVMKWCRRNPTKQRLYNRRWWWKHHDRNLVKMRESTAFIREKQRLIKKSVLECVLSL